MMALTVQVFGGYAALVALGLLFASQTFHAFGLVAGWALAVLLWWGWRAVPGLVFGGFWLGLFEALEFGLTEWPQALLWASVTALLGTLQAALGYWLLWRDGHTRRVLESVGSVLRLIGHGALLSSLIGSFAGEWAWQTLQSGEFGVRSWFDGYLTTVLGVLLFTPLSLCWLGRSVPSMRERGRYLVLPLLAVSLIVALLNFGLAHWGRQAQDLFGILLIAAVLVMIVGIGSRHVLIARRNLELEQVSQRYQRLFEESPQPMWLYHVGTLRVLMANRSAVALHGMSMLEFVGSSMQELLAPGMPAYWLDEHGEAMRQAYQADSRHQRRDGSSFEVQLATIPDHSEGRDLQLLVLQDVNVQHQQQMRQVLRVLRDIVDDLVGHGRLTKLDASLGALVRDITDLVRERETSRQELANMKYALDQHAIVSCTDLDGRITYANRRFCEVSGYRQHELVGRSHNIVNSGVHSPAFWADLWQTIRHGKVWRGEICNRHQSGSLYWMDVAIVPVFDTSGLPQQYIAIRTDITQSKQVKQQLQLARDQADRANQAKSEFLANMSHEIRTPLNAMLGLVQVLGRTRLEQDQLDVLNRIHGAGRVLLSQLSDVLDFSKIEAGQMSLESRPFTLEQVLDDINGLQRSAALERGLAFEFDAPALDCALMGDAVRLSQILLNLTGNAIKFTPRGWVRLTVRELEHSGQQCRLRFEVADSGIGIAADKLSSLFQPFHQADSGVTRRFGGTGLGLSICKHLVELMGGAIDVTSVEGQGSTFGFELPFECAACKPESDQVSLAGAEVGAGFLINRHLLVVDDNEMNRDMMQRMLHQEGAVVALAVDGQEAVRMLELDRDGFDLVLMDNQMPVMDGLQATRQIRAGLGLVELPVVICSAGVRAEDREHAMAAGATDFMAKPIERERLLVVLARALEGRRAPVPPAAFEPAPPPVLAKLTLPADWPEIEGIDGERLVAQLDGDSEYFRQILVLLRRDLTQLLDQLPGELAQGQFETVGGRLHKLRGAAAMVCAQPLADACSELEDALDASAQQREQAQGVWMACASQLLARIQAI